MRCFIGVPVAGAMTAWLRGRPLPEPANATRGRDLHMTLAFLGERDEDWVRGLWPALSAALAGTPAFAVAITGIGPFPRPGGRIWAASLAADTRLIALHETVRAVLKARGLEHEPRRFRPHITLARSSRPLEGDLVVRGAPPLPVEQVVLYQSPGEGRPYRKLCRRTLY